MNVDVTALPGIGVRKDFEVRSGRRVGVVAHRDGDIDLIVSKPDDPDAIAAQLGLPQDEVEKALVQMRSRRPETTRGTLNVTLAAHRLLMAERRGDEPVWQTVDRMFDELLRLRADAEARRGRKRAADRGEPLLPLPLPGEPQVR